jgi:hypothetical protein
MVRSETMARPNGQMRTGTGMLLEASLGAECGVVGPGADPRLLFRVRIRACWRWSYDPIWIQSIFFSFEIIL